MSRNKAYVQASSTPPKQYLGEINHYGLCSPSSQRKTLIDQIITKCKMIESPRIPLIQGPTNCTLTNSAKTFTNEDKENCRRMQPNHPLEKIDYRRQSLEKRYGSAQKPSIQSSKHQTQTDWRAPRNTGEEYYIHSLGPKHTPIQPIPVTQMTPKRVSSSFNKKVIELRSEIQRQKDEHLSYCRQEERKLRLYFKQLENKLNQIRNQELKTFAQYQITKTKEFDECMRQTQSETKENAYELIQQRFQQIKKHAPLKVEQQQKLQVKGCLRTGLNGMLFSFDQIGFQEKL